MTDELAISENSPPSELPDPIELFKETFDGFSKDIGPYLLAGLGQFAVVLPVVFTLILVIYFGLFIWMFGGMMVFGLITAIGVELLGDSLGVLGGFIAMLLWYAAGFAALIAVSVGVGAALAPLNASLARRVAAYQKDGRELDFTATFSDAGQDIGSVIGVSLLVGGMVSLGVMFLYLPGLIAYAFFGHAAYLVALNRYGVIDAMKTSASHFMKHTSYYAMFWVLYFACAMVVSYIPIVGPMYLVAVHIRAHRELFGEPVAA